jgi:hypothetical protein
LDKRNEHFRYFLGQGFGSAEGLALAEFKFPGYHDLSLELKDRALRNSEKMAEFRCGEPSTPFGDIACNRNACAAHLRDQAVKLIFEKRTSQSIDANSQFDRSLPHDQVFELLCHSAHLPLLAFRNAPSDPDTEAES